MTIGLLAARSPDLATHTALFGPLPNSLQPGTLTCLLADAELAGKGGERRFVRRANSIPSPEGAWW